MTKNDAIEACAKMAEEYADECSDLGMVGVYNSANVLAEKMRRLKD